MKKRLFLSLFCVLFLCSTLLSGSLLDLLVPKPSRAAFVGEARDVIIIDAGHGGIDGGATGVNGVLEKDLNLSLSSALAALFRMAGYTALETRTDDRMLGSDVQKHRKMADLNARLNVMKQYENPLFVSIHMNTFPFDSCQGLQVWYSPNHERSRALADAVQKNVKTYLQPANNRKTKVATSSIYLLKHATCPAILIECGFLSSPEECERLSSESYRQMLALTVFYAICQEL